MISRYHDLYLGPWLALNLLPVAVGFAADVQLAVSDICQFDASRRPGGPSPGSTTYHATGPGPPGRSPFRRFVIVPIPATAVVTSHPWISWISSRRGQRRG